MAFPTGWGRRCALVIQSSKVTDTETNFPMLVTKDTLPSEMFDADGSYPAINGGGDIRFSSDEAGNTQLACEIEQFVTDNDPANGKAAIWVKVPSIASASNTTIYIWYNKSGETQPLEGAAYGKHAVWDSNYELVQHMNQDPSGTAPQMIDSTSNSNDGTSGGSMTSGDQVDGKIDGSLDFDAGDDYIGVGTSVDPPENSTTLSFWYYWAGSDGSHQHMLVKRDGWAMDNMRWQLARNSAGNIRWENQGSLYNFGVELTQNQWTHLVVTQDAGDADLYSNGAYSASVSHLTYGTDATAAVEIGGLSAGYAFNGKMDEVRISDSIRSAGWIETEYNNQNSPATFIIEGTPTTPGAAAGSVTSVFYGPLVGPFGGPI